MKTILGLILISVGVVVGLYVGFWWAFIGGITQIVNAVIAPEVIATTVAWGVAKVVFASLLGWISALVFIIPGWGLVTSGR